MNLSMMNISALKSLNIYENKAVSKRIQQSTRHWFVDCHLLDSLGQPSRHFLHTICVDYRQITKVNVSLLIIHTKRMFASRKEGWAGETKKRHRKCSFCQSWFVGFCCLGLIFMAQHLMKYLLFGHPCFATFDEVFIVWQPILCPGRINLDYK